MKMRFSGLSRDITACLCVLFISSWATAEGSEGPADVVASLAEQFWLFRLEESPEYGTKYGVNDNDDDVEQYTEEVFSAQVERSKQFLEEIADVNRDELNLQDKITLDIMEYNLNAFINGYRYREYGLYNAFASMATPLLDWKRIASQMKFNTAQDYENLISRLGKFSAQMDQIIDMMRTSLASNLTLYSTSFRSALGDLDSLLTVPANETFLFKPFLTYPQGIGENERRVLADRAEEIIQDEVKPAVQRLRDFVVNSYLFHTRSEAGVGSLPGGTEYYEECVRWHTTTNMTPDEVHNAGLQEVSRIYEKMVQMVSDAGFSGTLKEYVALLRNDSNNFYQTEEAMLQGFKDIAAETHGKLSNILKVVPKAELVIEMSTNPGGGLGFYADPSLDGSRPGMFIANVYNPQSKLKIDMPALTLHEAEPGHHTQANYAIELDMPYFRRAIEFRKYQGVPFNWPFMTGYIEGWALYSESLGEEMGTYSDPLTLFGRYSSEIFRAARLVVDTGIHVMGWSQERAIEYIANYTVLPRNTIVNEVYRYTSWPGQALSYKIGELKIKEIRKFAEDELGEKFDIKEFHDTVLQLGPAPLHLLEEFVRAWVDDVKGITGGVGDNSCSLVAVLSAVIAAQIIKYLL